MKLLVLFYLAVTAFGAWEPPNSALDDIEQQIERGRALLGTDKDDEGKAECLKAVAALEREAAKNPKDAEIAFLTGKTYFYLERNEDARKAYHRAIALAPEMANYHFMLGILEKFADKPEQAARHLTKATDLAPRESEYWLELASLLDQLGQAERAERAALKAVEFDGRNVEALRLTGALKAEQEDFDAALEYFERAVTVDSKDVDLNYNCGQMSQNLGRSREALKFFQAVAKLAPDDWRAQTKIVQCAEAVGDTKTRDQARERVFKLKRQKKIDKELFVRDQFKVTDRLVMAMEYFELGGDEAVRYSFNVMDDTGTKSLYRISLGSYDCTNEYAHAVGSIAPNDRLFHLDRYEGGAHKTYSFFNKEPAYEAVKKMVVEIMEGKREHTSSMTPTSQGAIIELDVP